MSWSTSVGYVGKRFIVSLKLHDALSEALETIEAGGLIRKYSLVWSRRSEAPRIDAPKDQTDV